MIKEETIEAAFYCLNPFCSDKNNRKFKNDDRHMLQEQCKKWIVEVDRLNVVYEPLLAKNINNLQIDFEHHPIEAFERLCSLRQSQWRKILDGEQAKVKKEIMRTIEVQFETVREKIQQLLQNAQIFTKICKLAEDNTQPSGVLNEFYEQHLFQINDLHSKVLFKRMQLKESIHKIKQEVQKIFQTIIEQQSNEQKGIITHQQQRKFHQFMFENNNELFNKLQQLAPALKKKVPQFQYEQQNTILNCFLCERFIRIAVNPSNKKLVKRYLAEQILTHIYCSHYGETAFAYSHKIAKSFLISLTFEEFLSQSRKSTKIIIVDRDSGVIFEEHYSAQSVKTFTVEVVSVKNAGMARGRHILVQNHLSNDSLVAILSYVCTQRDQNVEIVTNRVTLKTGIQQLMWTNIAKGEIKNQ